MRQRTKQRISDRSFEAKQRAFHAIARMRSDGLSLKAAAIDEGTTPGTVRKHLPAALFRSKSGKWKAKKGDRYSRPLKLPGPQGYVTVRARGSAEAELASAYSVAVARRADLGPFIGKKAPWMGASHNTAHEQGCGPTPTTWQVVPIKMTPDIVGTDKPLTKDVFLRSHVVELDPKKPEVSSYREPKWPEYALVFDTETTLDPREQSFLFGFYRVCQLQGKNYRCVEEGILHADDLKPDYLKRIKNFACNNNSEVVNSDNDDNIHIYTRAHFVERIFFDAVRTRSLIVAFNAPWDISRLSVGYKTGRNRAWTLVLSERVSRKTGELEWNPERPCVRVTTKDSKSAFFSLTKPLRPEEWPAYQVGGKTRLVFRVLDLRTLEWALFNESYSLKTACKELHTQNQKFDHEPTGTVTIEELEYARQDVRCTVEVLNSLKEEMDRHPIKLHPDKSVSPASVGKAYLRAMGIKPPKTKFEVPDYIHGIAAQAYFGGRSEIKIRHTPVPVVLTDFSSQYPTVNALLGNWDVLIAERLSFVDATDEVRKFIERVTLDDCFEPNAWKQMKFFARVRPEGDVLPIRAEYNDDGVTKNIGINYLTSTEPVWLSGPDLIAAKLLSGKFPIIEMAIRMVPHGQQKRLKSTNLREMVQVDPHKRDLFCLIVEQKKRFTRSPMRRFPIS